MSTINAPNQNRKPDHAATQSSSPRKAAAIAAGGEAELKPASFPRILRLLRGLLTRREKAGLTVIMVGVLVSALLDAGCIAGLSIYTSVLSGKVPAFLQAHVDLTSNAKRVAVLGGVIVIVLFCLKFVFVAALVWFRAAFAARMRVRISLEMYKKYIHAPWQFHLLTNSATLQRNVIAEGSQIPLKALTPFITLVASVMQGVAVLAVLLATADVLGLLPLIPVAIVLVLFMLATRGRLVRYGREHVRDHKNSVMAVREGLDSIPESTILGKHEYVISRYHSLMLRLTAIQKKQMVIGGVTAPVMETAVICGLIGVIFTMSVMGKTIAEIAPMLVVMAAVSLRLRSSLVAATSASNQLKFAQASLDLVSAELAGPTPRPPASKSELEWDTLTLEGVGFTFEGAAKPSLTHIDLTLSHGDRIGIVGGSGAGKSTLVALILGLLEPTEGRLYVDGKPLKKVLGGWHKKIGYVPQSVFIADDTIRRNVAFGVEDCAIDEERLKDALKLAQLSEVVASLPEGANTVAGENGCRLSGGQRQRVGLARALYRKPEILILDEATSSLDEETEARFIDTVQSISGDLTVVSIAHRIKALCFCERVIRLDDGRITDTGSYERVCLLKPHLGTAQIVP